MKICGIYPQQIDKINLISRSTSGEPIGLAKMLSIAKAKFHKTKYIPFIDNNIEITLREIVSFNADIYLFSILTCQINLAKSIAKNLKKQNPNALIIAGGYHPSCDLPIETPFDIYVIGEGEKVFSSLLQCIENGNSYEDLPGIKFKTINNKSIINSRKDRVDCIDDYPLPIRHEDVIKQKYYGLIYPNELIQTGFAYIEFSRGCFFNCSFCCKNVIYNGNKIIYREVLKVVEEIKSLISTYNVNLLFFTDLNFTSSPQHVKMLCQEIIKQKVNVSWFCMSNIETMLPELLPIMKEAGCVKTMYGIESININTIRKINKPVDNAFLVLNATMNSGILTQVFYVIGFPWETEDDINKSISKIIQIPAHQLRMSVASPLPGSKWYNEMDKNRLSNNFNLYNTENIVYSNSFLNQKKIQKLTSLIYQEFYKSPIYYDNLFKVYFEKMNNKDLSRVIVKLLNHSMYTINKNY